MSELLERVGDWLDGPGPNRMAVVLIAATWLYMTGQLVRLVLR